MSWAGGGGGEEAKEGPVCKKGRGVGEGYFSIFPLNLINFLDPLGLGNIWALSLEKAEEKGVEGNGGRGEEDVAGGG